MEVRTKISVELVLTAPFTDLSKGGDTTSSSPLLVGKLLKDMLDLNLDSGSSRSHKV